MNIYSYAHFVVGITILIAALYTLDIKQETGSAIVLGLIAAINFVLAKHYSRK